MIHEKTWSKKSRDTVPLKPPRPPGFPNCIAAQLEKLPRVLMAKIGPGPALHCFNNNFISSKET